MSRGRDAPTSYTQKTELDAQKTELVCPNSQWHSERGRKLLEGVLTDLGESTRRTRRKASKKND